jgi:hypothetical protein
LATSISNAASCCLDSEIAITSWMIICSL